MIPVIQKASNVCSYCRVRKQRCDRKLPRCSRCANKVRLCDYNWVKDALRLPEPAITPIEPMWIRSGDYGSDLSSRSGDILLQAFTARINREPNSIENLSNLVLETLDVAGVKIPKMLEEHVELFPQWCPMIDEDSSRGHWQFASASTPPGQSLDPLLLLCIFLLSRRIDEHDGQPIISLVYTTVKHMLTLALVAADMSLELSCAQMLLALYEFGHGLTRQAYVTLSSCVAILNLIHTDMSKAKVGALSEELVSSVMVSVMMLDRMIALSTLSPSMPLLCSMNHPLNTILAGKIDPTKPPHCPTLHPYSHRRVHIRALVTLASGRALEYIHALQSDSVPQETYDEVDAALSRIMKNLLEKPQPYTWLHCDSIALTFCSYLLLQQTQMRHLRAKQSSSTDAKVTKAVLALHYSRRMVWDMIRLAIRQIPRKEDLPILPFAGLCCVLRGAISVLETEEFVHENEHEINEEEISRLTVILGWFAARWHIGGTYVKHIKACLDYAPIPNRCPTPLNDQSFEV